MNRTVFPSVLLLLVSCAAPPYAAYAIENDAEAVSQVVVGDAALLDVLRAGRPLVERMSPEDNLRVIVPLRNIYERQIQVLAQMAFLDAQRNPLPDETNQQVVILPAGSTQNFQAISHGRRAADFVLRVTWYK